MLRPPWWQITTSSASGSTSPARAWISPMGTCTEPSMRQVWYSQGSRSSSNTGFALLESESHAASCGADSWFTGSASKLAARRVLGVHQRREHRFEQLRGGERAGRGAGHEARGHRRRFADHGEEAPANRELREEVLRE